MSSIDPASVARMVLILMHLLAFATAAASAILTDYAIFGSDRVDIALLRRAAGGVSISLLALWISGAAVIWLDTHFVLAVILQAPKLLAKLTVVSVLTLNGVALHWLAFPRLADPRGNPARAARLPAVLGAISTTTWLFAAFLGVAKAVAPVFGYAGFILFYLSALGCAIPVALLAVRPRLARRIAMSSAAALGAAA